jgi:hypothetical protein
MNTDAASMLKIKKPKISQFKIIFTYSYYNVFVYYNKPTHHTIHPFRKPTHASHTGHPPIPPPTHPPIPLKRDNHPKNPSVKSMAPPAPRECNQPARSALHHNQFTDHLPAHRIPCIAAHCIASRVSHPVHRSALHHKQSAHRAARRPHR